MQPLSFMLELHNWLFSRLKWTTIPMGCPQDTASSLYFDTHPSELAEDLKITIEWYYNVHTRLVLHICNISVLYVQYCLPQLCGVLGCSSLDLNLQLNPGLQLTLQHIRLWHASLPSNKKLLDGLETKKVKKERDRVREQVPQTCLYLLTDATQKSRLPRVTI